MKAYFVTFYSPGTIVAENTTQSINSWDVETATEMARSIIERHGAIPYGFVFTTRARADNELDSKEVERSGFYWLGGTVLALAEVKARNDPRDRTLIRNMECNGWDRVVQNDNSWRWTQPLSENDVVLDFDATEARTGTGLAEEGRREDVCR